MQTLAQILAGVGGNPYQNSGAMSPFAAQAGQQMPQGQPMPAQPMPAQGDPMMGAPGGQMSPEMMQRLMMLRQMQGGGQDQGIGSMGMMGGAY